MSIVTPGGVLLAAQQEALSHDERIQTLSLNSLTRAVPTIPIVDRLTRAEVTLTIDGASSIELDIEDPQWLIERSGVLDPDGNGTLNAVGISVDGIAFRLADARRSPGSAILTLEFEDLAMALLDTHNKPIGASRGSKTRAQFIELMVREVKARNIALWAPDSLIKQPVARPDLPTTAPKQGETGFDKGAKFDIQGSEADAQQMREVATALGVADQEAATDRPRLAMLVGGNGESGFHDVPNAAGSPYGGVFQSLKTRNLSTEQEAHYFLRGGQGYQGGGAIALARAHPDWTPGHIAYVVEGSRSNFSSDAEAEHHYQQHIDDARKILALWQSGSPGTSQVLRFKQYRFTRGLPGQKETSRQAAQRLAQEVNWRFYAIGGLAVFTSDDQMISQPAGLILEPTENPDGTINPPTGLLGMPGYEHLHGKLPSQIELKAVASAWSVFPGEVVVLRGMGTINGRWIVETFRFNLLDATAATVTLIKPLPQRKEPAPEATTVATGSTPTTTSGNDQVVKPTIKAGAMRPGTQLNDGIETFLGIIGRRLDDPVIVTTGTNHNRLTISGHVSDHFAGDAADMGTAANGVARCDQICFQALRLCGLSTEEARKLSTQGIGQAGVSLRWRDYRVQVFWRSNDPGIGDHYDHVHIGVARA